MTRTSLDHHNCSLARTADVIGDRWSLMILREAFIGVRRFSQFKQHLGITQAVLSARLTHLVAHGLLEKIALGEVSSREAYQLTAKGRALLPVMVAMMQWGDRFLHEDIGPPLVLYNSVTDEPIDPLRIMSAGVDVAPEQVVAKSGPGATEATRALLASLSRDVAF